MVIIIHRISSCKMEKKMNNECTSLLNSRWSNTYLSFWQLKPAYEEKSTVSIYKILLAQTGALRTFFDIV